MSAHATTKIQVVVVDTPQLNSVKTRIEREKELGVKLFTRKECTEQFNMRQSDFIRGEASEQLKKEMVGKRVFYRKDQIDAFLPECNLHHATTSNNITIEEAEAIFFEQTGEKVRLINRNSIFADGLENVDIFRMERNKQLIKYRIAGNVFYKADEYIIHKPEALRYKLRRDNRKQKSQVS
jgi:hypothetical protein